MEIAKYIAAAAAGYLLGSVSASVLLSKLAFRRDVRAEGSGNAGATNVARVFGMWAGIATLLADVGKTVLAILLGQWLAGDMGLCIAGIACILGHCWPMYFHFRRQGRLRWRSHRADDRLAGLCYYFYCILRILRPLSDRLRLFHSQRRGVAGVRLSAGRYNAKTGAGHRHRGSCDFHAPGQYPAPVTRHRSKIQAAHKKAQALKLRNSRSRAARRGKTLWGLLNSF